ncbi:MAG: hypothetical protein Q8S58_18305 [Bosea sp. (in: a-proteobacteria)]|uniref:hypothetical protein n=1 Tax=Bosea sp. (in: a-proteobacteria) TaxID=1871050 RepID=UPI0027325348|nr:hypothetical protein [Bosea sp. (in: a-proteobacteria)]MDP3258436.1 hypothetical protein [Bosea sp. (in: a-proteobacteria)]MDP3321080.1 hypothetical protein [Bosea sp. (in: a-proteobacteria)]
MTSLSSPPVRASFPNALALAAPLLLATAPIARAQSPAEEPGQMLDAAFGEEAQTSLFAPIPRWEATAPEPEPERPGYLPPGSVRHAARPNPLARPEIAATPIRRGLTPTGVPLPAATERAIGMKLGADKLSLSTEIVTGQGGWQRSDTRLGWNVTRGADAESDIVWSAAAGGSLPASGTVEQNGEAVLGYRLRPIDIVTLTTEIALAGNYSFAAQNGLAGSLTPRVKVVADLTQPLATPWRTTLDLSLGRQVPMVGRDLQTSGTALLKLELPTP